MTAPIPFDPNRFRSAAQHYFARPDYSPRLIRKVADGLALSPADRVMDLGCGPAFLAIAFAPHVGEVVAIDPAPEMLAAGREAAGAFAARIRFVEGDSNGLDPRFGPVKLVAMGRSFHWMDRTDTLKRLEAIITEDGAIALFDIDMIREGPDDWHAEFEAITERYSGRPAAWQDAQWKQHAAFLIESAFSQVEGISVVERRSFPAGQLVDLAFSMSRTAPAVLGPERAAALAAEMSAFADRIAVDGMIGEILESKVLIARRP